MPTRKDWLVKDAKTGRKVYSNGRGVYSLSNKGGCTILATIMPTSPDRLEFFRLRIEKNLGRPVVLVEGPEVEYINIW